MYVFISYIRNCCFHNQQRRKLFASLLFYRRRRRRSCRMTVRMVKRGMMVQLDPVQTLMIISDDTVLTKQILETHSPDGREINCPKLIQIIEEILYRATPLGIQAAMPEESKPSDSDSAMLGALSYLVRKISDEMAYKCMANADAHSTTVTLLQNLSSYNWDAKLVLLLAAFVLNYGEFWLHFLIHASNKLARKVAMLKQVPELDKMKQQFGELNPLIMLILDLAKCIVGFTELPSDSKYFPELSTACGAFPAAIYWATRGIVCAAYTIQYASSFSTLSSGTLGKELSLLVEKMNNFNKRLQDQLTHCYGIIEKKKENDAYEQLAKIIEMKHTDNLKVLGALLSTNNDEAPLVECPTRRTVNLKALRMKYVLLLISGLIEPNSLEVEILNQIYQDSKTYSGIRGGYEIVWIPIVDRRQITEDAAQQKFQNIQASMHWCSVPHLSSISNPVKKFIKEKFRYRNSPILVVLDPQGSVSSHNAFHMMFIWGSFGFPYTRQREKALWQEEIWKLDMIVNGIEEKILQWMVSGKYIILYGGDDMQWITQFTDTARRVAQAGIQLEMIYVGKYGKEEHELKPLVETINKSRLSNSLTEIIIRFFWTRLESMLLSKVQLEANDEQDPVMQEIEKLLMYDGIGTWALFSKGIDVCFTGHGPTVLHVMQKFDEWKINMEHEDFLVALKEEYDQLVGADHPCCHLVFEETAGMVPENMVCPDCHQPMKQYAIYSCSHRP